MRAKFINVRSELALISTQLKLYIGLLDVALRVLAKFYLGVQVEALVSVRQPIGLVVVEGLGLESRFSIELLLLFQFIGLRTLFLIHHSLFL